MRRFSYTTLLIFNRLPSHIPEDNTQVELRLKSLAVYDITRILNRFPNVGFDVLTAVVIATCFRAGFLHGLFFEPEDEGDMFLRNVD
jgi:hypothetical protein